MALRLQVSGLATIALIADRVSPTFGFENVYARLRRRATPDYLQRARPPPHPPRPNLDESSACHLAVGRAPNPGMAIAGSLSRDDASYSHPGATQSECFDADMAVLAACVGAGGSEQAVFHLRKMRLR